MRIQDFGILVGIFFICIAMGLGLAVETSDSIHLDLTKTGIPFIEQSPYILGGFGGFLAIISLISLARAR